MYERGRPDCRRRGNFGKKGLNFFWLRTRKGMSAIMEIWRKREGLSGGKAKAAAENLEKRTLRPENMGAGENAVAVQEGGFGPRTEMGGLKTQPKGISLSKDLYRGLGVKRTGGRSPSLEGVRGGDELRGRCRRARSLHQLGNKRWTILKSTVPLRGDTKKVEGKRKERRTQKERTLMHNGTSIFPKGKKKRERTAV